MGVVLATLLISTVSAMVIAGPRVLQVIGEDFSLFRLLSRKNANQIPMIAIVTQSAVTLIFILTSTFESVLVFSGFVMGVNTFFAVAGVFLLRRKLAASQQDEEGKTSYKTSYKTWGYPVTPLIYLGLMAWTLTYILINRPEEGWAGLGMIVAGGLLYLFSEKLGKEKTADVEGS
jgi:APA family basic amino acid/polyamine antiporter